MKMSVTEKTIVKLIPDVLVMVFKYLDVRGRCSAAQVCREWRDIASARCVWRKVLLPPRILAEVFEYLDTRSKGRVAQVCRTWRDIAYVPRIWRDAEVSRMSPSSLVDEYIRRGIRRLRPSVHHFDLNRWIRDVEQFMSRRDNLEAAEISLVLDGFVNRVSDESLGVVLRATSTSLRSLVLRQCGSVSPSALDVIGTKCPNLVELGFVQNCFPKKWLSSVGLDVWNACRKLEQLKTVDLRSSLINDDFFRSLAADRQSPKTDEPPDKVGHGRVPKALPLRTLHLNDNGSLTGTSLKYIGRYLPQLTELSLADCSGIAYDAVKHISPMINLRRLTLPCLRPFDHNFKLLAFGDQEREYYNDIGVSSLAISGVLRRLQSLSVVGISDQAMEVIIPFCHVASGTTGGSLESLQINEGTVTDQCLASLANHSLFAMCRLRQLKLVSCERITDIGIESLAVTGRLTSIRDLDLRGCTKLGDDSLVHIAEAFPRLHSIILRRCHSISEIGVRHLVAGCRHLWMLDASYTGALSQQVLFDIASNLDLLEILLIYEYNSPSTFMDTDGFRKLLGMRMLKTIGWSVHKYTFGENEMQVVNHKAYGCYSHIPV